MKLLADRIRISSQRAHIPIPPAPKPRTELEQAIHHVPMDKQLHGSRYTCEMVVPAMDVRIFGIGVIQPRLYTEDGEAMDLVRIKVAKLTF